MARVRLTGSQKQKGDADALGGRAPYWTGYTYNDAGQRTSETDHTTGQKDTYCYTGDQPHTLTSTAADCTNPGRTYAYDPAGNTTQRPGQTLTWNTEGKLAQVTEGVVDTNYLYDASGNLLIRETEGGERVLHAGDTELHLRGDGTLWAQRYYGTQDMTIAVRSNRDTSSGTELSYLATDKHRTSTLAIGAGGKQTFVKRALTPFGQARTEARVGDWADDKAFIGKTHDTATGLTHIGAREYDPTTGTFLSVDPLLETDKPQTLNGYTYGAQNPYTYTDPTGEGLACGSKRGMPDCPEHGQIDSSGRTGSGGMLSVTSSPVGDGHLNTGTVRDRFGDVVRVTNHYREYTKPVGDGGKTHKEESEDGSFWRDVWDSTGGKVVSAIADGAGSSWRNWADVAAFGACFVSLRVCAIAVAAVITAKAAADYHTHGFDYASKNFAVNLQYGAIGLGTGALVGKVWRAGVQGGRIPEYLPLGRHRRTSSGRHAKMSGRHALRRDGYVRTTELGSAGGFGLTSCAVPNAVNPGYC